MAFWKRSIRFTSACSIIGICGRQGILGSNLSSLGPFPGIFKRGIISRRGNACRAQSHVDPGAIHHLEHVAETLVGLAHQPAAAVFVFAEGQLGDGSAPVAQLVINPGAVDVVRRQVAVGFDPFLGNNEQGNAFNTCRRVLDPADGQMNDVINAVMFAGGDEYLLAFHLVIALIRRSPGQGNIRKRTSRLGLRQGHGSLPLARHHLGQIHVAGFFITK